MCIAETDPGILTRSEHVAPLLGGGSVSHHSNTLEDGRSIVHRHHTQTSNDGLRAFLTPQGQFVNPGFVQRGIFQNSPGLLQDQAFFVNDQGLIQAQQQPFLIQSPSLFQNQVLRTNPSALFQQQVLRTDAPPLVHQPLVSAGAPAFLQQQASLLQQQPSVLQQQPSLLQQQPSLLQQQPSLLQQQPSLLQHADGRFFALNANLQPGQIFQTPGGRIFTLSSASNTDASAIRGVDATEYDDESDYEYVTEEELEEEAPAVLDRSNSAAPLPALPAPLPALPAPVEEQVARLPQYGGRTVASPVSTSRFAVSPVSVSPVALAPAPGRSHLLADSNTSVFQGYYSFPNAGIDFNF